MNAFLETKPIHRYKPPKPKPPKNRAVLLILIAISAILLINQYKGVDFIELDEAGTPKLSKERQEKLDNKLKELDEGAEQYVLKATIAKYYPCYNCVGIDSIFLYPGEVWKYGVKSKSYIRYSTKYLTENFLLLLVLSQD